MMGGTRTRRTSGETTARGAERTARGGFALVTVVLVLVALLMLCTPFLLTARNADQASQQIFSRAEVRLALDNALTHARASLRHSHSSLDDSRYADSLEELSVDYSFPKEFLDSHSAEGLMWDAEVDDVAGKIDINSAPPQVIAAMCGSVTRLVKPVKKEDQEIPVASTSGLDPEGFIWLGGELIHYGELDGNLLIDLDRGLGVTYDEADNPLPGPRPPSNHGVGAIVLDQRAFAPVEWRLYRGDTRDFDSYDRLEEADRFVLAEGGQGASNLARIRRMGTVFGGLRGGSRWQRAARMTQAAQREVDGHVRVDSTRWFNQGATVRITDGTTTELAVVRTVGRGAIVLDRGLANDYDAFSAEVRVLSRRPVNLNTASREVLGVLFENLKIRGRNQRITGSEASTLADLVIESRPFEGLEDFLRRLVLPAGGIEALPNDAEVIPDAFAQGTGGVIDGWDAVALYTNALNANDAALEYSTMPFCFTSSDVYDFSLRATANASSGVERYSAVRDQTELIVPQEELTYVWGTQEDYDLELRLNREAPYWMTGPESTTRHDNAGSFPPTRMWAHLGTWEGQVFLPGVVGTAPKDVDEAPIPEHVYASREPDNGWAQLGPARIDDSADRELNGRVLHFDHETRDPEGRYLPDQVIRYPGNAERVQWEPGTGLMRGMSFSLWIKPRSLADAVILDAGGSAPDADRLSLLFEAGDLVLRVFDGGGDHRDTAAFKEIAEVRYALASGESPGLPAEVWSHIEIDVRGTRPDQMLMLVNGLTHGVRTPGLTRLVGQVGENDTLIPVESTEGFPGRGVLRIGNELIEYNAVSGNAFECSYIATGPDAGFGGRNARVRWNDQDEPFPANLGITTFIHPRGAPVELYGFAAALESDIPAGRANLPAELGPFRVATVEAIAGGPPLGDEILLPGLLGGFFSIGTGINGSASQVTGLVLVSAENPDAGDAAQAAEVMKAFNPQGGYAALLQRRISVPTADGTRIGGWEVVRYSGWSGTTLEIAAWGDGVPELKNLQKDGGVRSAWVVHWAAINGEGVEIQSLLDSRLFVIPISIPVPGASGASGFLEATIREPQFAQLTEPESGELTEWVAYNSFQQGTQQLVRDDPAALEAARWAAIVERDDIEIPEPGPGGGGGGGGGGGFGGGPTDAGGGAGAGSEAFFVATGPAPPSPAAGPPPAPAAFGPQWQAHLGEPEDLEFPLTRAVRESFQHRGVLGTYPHAHAAGTLVLPVFRLREYNTQIGEPGIDGGHPGKNDPVFLMGADFGHIGWPVTVHRAHWASRTVSVHPWQQQAGGGVVATAGGTTLEQTSVAFRYQNSTLCALTTASPSPMVAGTIDPTRTTSIVDSRAIARMTLFPSGERPRSITQVVVGGGTGGEAIPSALVDEVVFGATDFGTRTPNVDPESTQGGQLVLIDDFYDGDLRLHVAPNTVRIPLMKLYSTHEFLDDVDEDAGLLRLGNEILAYEAIDRTEGYFTIGESGRGLLGTIPGSFQIGTPVSFLDGFCVTVLSATISATDSRLPVSSTDEFPGEGTVLIGRELIHYTRLRGGALEMPAGSRDAGELDRKGPGLFRGRYGTTPAGHQAGEVVILFPFRYWDRWTERADAPELSYFGLELSQPAAFWRAFTWTDDDPGLAGVELGVLMRTDPDVPWDADPENTPGLEVFYRGSSGGKLLPIGVQSDLIQWRAFVKYTPGAFDWEFGLSHGWRATPRLTALMVKYFAPSMTLRSLER